MCMATVNDLELALSQASTTGRPDGDWGYHPLAGEPDNRRGGAPSRGRSDDVALLRADRASPGTGATRRSAPLRRFGSCPTRGNPLVQIRRVCAGRDPTAVRR